MSNLIGLAPPAMATAIFPNTEARTRTPTPALLRGRDLLCFSHDWTGDPLSKTHLMRLLARDNRVLWVNSIGYRTPRVWSGYDLRRILRKAAALATPLRQVERNIHVLNPLAVPFYGPRGTRLNRWLMGRHIRHAMRHLNFQHVINWVFNPAAGMIAGHLGEETLIYYCVDEYTAFSGVHTATLVELEQQLLRRADLVIVSAANLVEPRRQINPQTFLVRHGVDYEHFRTALAPATQIPSGLAGLPRPILGYFGLIARDWVDLELLIHVARRFPQASLVMLGNITMDVSRLAALPNVHLLGRQPYASLPAYARGFDVGLIPFPINPVTLHSNPLKAREYLAAGLPVVSTAIPEVQVLGQCRIAHDADSFVREIHAALRAPGPDAARSAAIRHESWDARLDEVRAHLATVTTPPPL